MLTILPLLYNAQSRTETLQTSPQAADSTSDMYGSIQLSTYQVYRGEPLEYNVTVMQGGLAPEWLNWTFAIQNFTGTDPNNLADWSNYTQHYSPTNSDTWLVPLTYSAGSYRVFLSIFNGTHETNLTRYFTVFNNLPVISSISADKYSVKRDESFNVSVTVEDAEIADLAPKGGTDGNIFVRIGYQDTQGATIFTNAQGLGNHNYSALINTIGVKSPTGVYTFWAAVQDYRPGMEPQKNVTSNVLLVTIQNQNPSIDIVTGLIINDLPSDTPDISVRIGNTINLTIIASDPEDSVRFVLISLLHESGTWKNYTLNYMFNPHTLIIDTADLSEGEWFIYLTVIDADGGIYTPQEHPSIMILADTWTMAAPIVFFIIGTLVGIAVGLAFFSWWGRRNAARQTAEAPVTEEEPKPSPEKARKISPHPEQKESEEEESGVEEEVEGEEKTAMKRKIRRRIN